MTPPPCRFRLNQAALRSFRSLLRVLSLVGLIAPCWRVSGKVFSGRSGVAGVVLHPMRDRVAVFGRLAAGAAKAASDLGGELQLLVVAAAGRMAPGRRRDDVGDAHGFGVDRGEQACGAEGAVFGAWRDQNLGAALPLAPGVTAIERLAGPQMPADQEPGQDSVESGGGAVAADSAQVVPLSSDDVVEVVLEPGGQLASVRWPDPVPVVRADVARCGSSRITGPPSWRASQRRHRGCGWCRQAVQSGAGRAVRAALERGGRLRGR